MYKNKCIVICGTTASGKSRFADSISRIIPSSIINADSQQIYHELPLLTDQPQISHYHMLYGHKSLQDAYNSYQWAVDAQEAVYKSVQSHRLPILVGGTGFYIRNFLYGHGDIDNPSHKTFFCNDIKFITIAITPPKAAIIDHARQRICDMFPRVLDEVANIISNPLLHPKAYKIIGVSEIISHINGAIDLNTCIEKILTRTMQYAKRQRTWFRHQMQYDLQINNVLQDIDIYAIDTLREILR